MQNKDRIRQDLTKLTWNFAPKTQIERELKPIPANFGQRQTTHRTGCQLVAVQMSTQSLSEQWSKPRGQKIEPAAVPQVVFVNPKLVRKKRPVRNTLTDCRNIKSHKKYIDHLKSLEECSMAYVVSSPRLTLNTHLGTVPVAGGLATSVSFTFFLYTMA
ncbi:uncharacterized protein LOC133509237 isoform X2 [Syngnathoides biaculeatus]|uniref:uncharacterized protein LOC133509237 isoform X2 n=1 Tax=Syngnathoides biaculeatus TaxID=300417 RepID=UPI002ADE31D8|nr:uncharacterized protein LOC133509237 isoform X2 [Syngnathoides biaculeatus]